MPRSAILSDMSLSDGIIGAAAAIACAAFGGGTTRWVTKSTLKSASELQSEKIEQEYALSGAERELSRRQDAYVPLHEHVRHYKWIIATLLMIASRRNRGLSEIPNRFDIRERDDHMVAEERRLFESLGPTPDEQAVLDATPNVEEDAHVEALVKMLGSDDVRREFDAFETSRDQIKKIISVHEAALQGLPAPLGSDPSSADVSDAAHQVISVAQASIGLARLPELTELFFGAAERLPTLMFEELSQGMSELQRQRRAIERSD